MDRLTDQTKTGHRPDYLRTRVTNGKKVLADTDGRSLWIRRLKDVMLAHIADLGGEEAISEAQKSVIRRIATQTVAIEKLEAQFAQEGEASDRSLDLHQRLSNTLRRNLEALGYNLLQKKAKPPVTIQAYLRGSSE
jgi:hypothetical protein